ncbi:hypothetical protein [Antarcticirhabdus aurantiaca]|uniref:Uncharacterized protein n=1 Tax=Antarcticirhabdus aurantiaca TaxID=2606717 RepID=A0ACD4NHN2_9HYPH|nr:hypothetical protein OXU80_15360 [Jeongeuplla avenae]
MKLADEIIITIGGEAVELRPCLRFAMKLADRPGSFAQIVREINDGSVTTAVEIISEHTNMQFLPSRVFEVLPELRGSLLLYIMACAGIDPDDKPDEDKPKANGKSVPFSEHLLHLYRIGTGWLGWSPETTLYATPAEIAEAYKGRLEMLKAIFGSGEASPPKDDRSLDDKFRSIFAGHQIVREGE